MAGAERQRLAWHPPSPRQCGASEVERRGARSPRKAPCLLRPGELTVVSEVGGGRGKGRCVFSTFGGGGEAGAAPLVRSGAPSRGVQGAKKQTPARGERQSRAGWQQPLTNVPVGNVL